MDILTELTSLGYTRKLEFQRDDSDHILVIKNTANNNQRATLTGDVGIPLVQLTTQNPTLKKVRNGVRFHLAST